MAIIFLNDIEKSEFSSKARARRLLRSFIDRKEPQLVYWLHHIWRNQGKAITYKELREMILNGDLDQEIIDEWQQDYSVFVKEYMEPLYREAMLEAAKELERQYPLFAFDPFTEGVRLWTDTMGAAFVTNSTIEQIEAVRFVIKRAAQLPAESVDATARAIRAMVGLNKPQAAANFNYYTNMLNQGMSQQKALEKSVKYAERQHRYRAHMIARTELAFAYNKGEHHGIGQAIEKGYMGKTVKVWSSAGDDRVCDICKELDRKTHLDPVAYDGSFDYYTKLKASNPDIDKTPPAHPHCRCAVIYKEIEPPQR